MQVASTQRAGGTDAAELRGLGLFGALDDAVLGAVAARLVRREVSADEVVFREGEPGRSMFVVLEGLVEVSTHADSGVAVPIAQIGPGSWFGEVAVLGLRTRSATARARVPTRLLELRAQALSELYRSNLKAYALLVMNLARELAHKLEHAERQVADALAPAKSAH